MLSDEEYRLLGDELEPVQMTWLAYRTTPEWNKLSLNEKNQKLDEFRTSVLEIYCRYGVTREQHHKWLHNQIERREQKQEK